MKVIYHPHIKDRINAAKADADDKGADIQEIQLTMDEYVQLRRSFTITYDSCNSYPPIYYGGVLCKLGSSQ